MTVDMERQLRAYAEFLDSTLPALKAEDVMVERIGTPLVWPVQERKVKRAVPGWVWAAAAAAVILIVVGVVGMLLAQQSDRPADVIQPAPTTPNMTVPSTLAPAPAVPATTPSPPATEMTATRARMDTGAGVGSAIYGVTAGGPGLVAVGSHDDDAAVWVSSDGSSWSRAPHDDSVFGGPREELMNDVTVGGPGFVAVGGHRSESFFDHADERCGAEQTQFCDPGAPVSASGALVWTSADGVEWSRVYEETSPGGPHINAVTVGGPGYVAVGGHWSKELFDFQPPCAPRDTQYCDAALADTAAAVWTSADGVTWSRVADESSIFAGEIMFDVVAGPSGLIAVGSAVWFSPDGITWTVVYDEDDLVYGPGDNRAGMRAVTRGGTGFVAVGWGGAIWRSTDGMAWSRLLNVDPVFGFEHLSAVASNSAGFVAVGQDSMGGPSGAFISPDGVSWTKVPHESIEITTFDGLDRGVFGASHPEDVIFAEPGLTVVGRSWQDETGMEVNQSMAAVWIMTDQPGG